MTKEAKMAEESSANVLRIGDYVTIKCVKWDSFLTAQGILNGDLCVSNDSSFDDTLFCVHLQRQYSAFREMNEFILSNNIDVKNIKDPNQAKYYKALTRGYFNENKLNDSYMKNKLGKPVVFGDIIQLYHVKSGKYLQVIPDKLAVSERENISVVLRAGGDIFSWFIITPRYKIDRDGDAVQSGAEMFLKICERRNEFIHVADRDPLPNQPREINCSLETTSFKITIFQSSADSFDPSLVLASQIVYINDPESRCNLTLSSDNIEDLDAFVEAGNDHKDDVLQDFIMLDPYIETESVSSNSLWYLEGRLPSIGGAIKWKTEQVRFKHFNTGKYLAFSHTQEEDDNGAMVNFYKLTSTRDHSDSSTLFHVIEINSNGKLLRNSKPLQIHHNDIWVERGDYYGSSYSLGASREKSNALALLIFKYEEDTNTDDTHGSSTNQVTSIEPLDIYVSYSARSYFRSIFESIVIPSSDNVSTIWPTADRDDFSTFMKMMFRVSCFIQGFPISAENVSLATDKGNDKLRIRRQNLIREQGFLELILRLVHRLKAISIILDALQIHGGKNIALTPEMDSMLRMGSTMLKLCFQAIYYCIKDNSENQMYVANHMTVLLTHISGQPEACNCVTEMLSTNIELQETKIGKREISIFVDKLRSSKMNSMYLSLLQSCCSCQGDGVDGNQCKIVELLFSNTNDIIIQMHADRSKLQKVDWNSNGLYIPHELGDDVVILGDTLITNGMPRLSIAWTTNSIDFSPLGLFGKLSVNIEELYTKIDRGKKIRSSSNSDQKKAVANYLIAQMFLCAEMALDR